MDRVFSINERSVDDSLFVAVLIGEPVFGQRHIGIMHRVADSSPAFLHLAWHCRLQNDDHIPGYISVWVAPLALRERLRAVAAICRRVWRKNLRGGIPYAFSKPNESFDPVTGKYLLGPSQFGLTCASFVFAVFEAAGLHLAEYNSWPTDRPGDRDWQLQIIASLEGRATQEHIDHLRTEIGAVRYRPEEVAAATALAPPSVDFNSASSLGSLIVAAIRQSP